MLFSQRSREGYLLIDHQASPGLASRTGLVGEGKRLELSTLTCSHCPSVQIKNPLRTRERGHCFKCHHYICDNCAVAYKINLVCRTVKQAIDEHQDGKTPTLILASMTA